MFFLFFFNFFTIGCHETTKEEIQTRRQTFNDKFKHTIK